MLSLFLDVSKKHVIINIFPITPLLVTVTFIVIATFLLIRAAKNKKED